MAYVNTEKKCLTLKSRSKQNSRVREATISKQQFAENWDSIFKKKEDKKTLAKYWHMVEEAINFVLNQKQTNGEINWAVDSQTGTTEEEIKTGCRNI